MPRSRKATAMLCRVWSPRSPRTSSLGQRRRVKIKIRYSTCTYSSSVKLGICHSSVRSCAMKDATDSPSTLLVSHLQRTLSPNFTLVSRAAPHKYPQAAGVTLPPCDNSGRNMKREAAGRADLMLCEFVSQLCSFPHKYLMIKHGCLKFKVPSSSHL